jgi:hypothetical protein
MADGSKDAKPVDVVLFCPACLAQHIDAPEPETGWTNPAHKSHLCSVCGEIFRPADVPTNGIALSQVKTRGERDTYPPLSSPPEPQFCDICMECGNRRVGPQSTIYCERCKIELDQKREEAFYNEHPEQRPGLYPDDPGSVGGI